MSDPSVKDIVRRIADVAKRTAIQQSPIVEGTVIGRNPDGSLVVYDGRGGCMRLAPKANVRVGERIRLGTEPALGRQTNLQQIDVTISPSSAPCPDDPRDDCEQVIGVVSPCPEPVEGEEAPAVADIFAVMWVDPPPGLAYPGRSGDWKNRLSASEELAGGPVDGALFLDPNKQVLQSISRRSSSYTSHFIDPYADQSTIACVRLFLDFNTSAVPVGATITAATLRVSVTGNGPVRASTHHSEAVRVMPSSHNAIASTANWDKVDPVILGEVSINDIIDAGPDPTEDFAPYNVDIPLDPELLTLFVNEVVANRTRLAIVMRLDSKPQSILPAPGLFSSGRETTPTAPTPDDEVHVAAGNVEIDHVTYTYATPYNFQINQQDGNGHTLTGSESYVAVIVQPPGVGAAPLVIKGPKSSGTPRVPTVINEGPGGIVGGIILSYVHVSCTTGNPSLIGSSDISEEPGARTFVNLGQPNEIRSSLDHVSFTMTGDVSLILAFVPSGGLS